MPHSIRFVKFICTIGLVCFSLNSWAVPILVGSSNNPTGIDGLVVGADEYNVLFSFASYSSTFTPTSPVFFGDEVGGTAAGTSLSAALTAFGVVGLDGQGAPAMTSLSLSIPVAFFAANGQVNEVIAFVESGTFPWEDQGPGGCVICNIDSPTNSGRGWAVFSLVNPPPVDVPEPATLALLGLGLAGIGFSRRKGTARLTFRDLDI